MIDKKTIAYFLSKGYLVLDKISLKKDKEDFEVQATSVLLNELVHQGFDIAPNDAKSVNTLVNDPILYLEGYLYWLQQYAGELDGIRTVLYPNFPKQFRDSSKLKLVMHAMAHYMSGRFPRTELIERLGYDLDTFPKRKFSVVSIDVAMEKVVKPKLLSRDSLPKLEAKILPSLLGLTDTHTRSQYVMKAVQAETKARILSYMINTKEEGAGLKLEPLDIVRMLQVNIEDGDPSLYEMKKYPRYSSREKTIIKNFLMTSTMRVEGNRAEKIKVLGKHIGYCPEWMFNKETYVQTQDSLVDQIIRSKNLTNLDKVSPGVFARRLSEIIEHSDYPDEVLKLFKEKIEVVPVNVLVSLLKATAIGDEVRLVNINGTSKFIGKRNLSKENLIRFQDVRKDIFIGISKRMIKNAPKVKSAYVDPRLDEIKIPESTRSLSKAIKTIPRGSKLPFDGNDLRFFIHWKNEKDGETVDVDMSTTLHDMAGTETASISYRSTFKGIPGIAASGDVTSAPLGAAEYIDLPTDNVGIDDKQRYAMIQIHSYTGQKYKDIPELYFGWMERPKSQELNNPHENGMLGDLYENKLVKQIIFLEGENTSSVVCMVDRHEKKIIWIDASRKTISCDISSAENKVQTAEEFQKNISKAHIPSQGELLRKMYEDSGIPLMPTADEAEDTWGLEEVYENKIMTLLT